MQVLWGECISGALYNEDFKCLAREAGFADPRVLSSSRIDVTDPELAQVVGNAAFSSITYRLFKLPGQLESVCEDYGQVAVYKVQATAGHGCCIQSHVLAGKMDLRPMRRHPGPQASPAMVLVARDALSECFREVSRGMSTPISWMITTFLSLANLCWSVATLLQWLGRRASVGYQNISM